MGGRRIRGLKTRVGRECCISRRILMDRLSSGVIKAGGDRRRGHSVGRCGTSRRNRDAAGRTAPGVRTA